MNRDLAQIRKDFEKKTLSKDDLGYDPIIHFKEWINEAIEARELEPTAMTLATVSAEGKPTARIVLLKQITELNECLFYTNYNSKKGQHLAKNKYASLSFFWPTLERQVRIVGRVRQLSEGQSDSYFLSRPIESQLSAFISPQSQPVKNRQTLEKWYQEAKNNNPIIKRPDHWGGYALIPDEIEFWQGRSGRLHDRICFTLRDNIWSKERLAP